MKKEKGHNLLSLVSLYTGYTFQKLTLIIFIMSLVLMTGFLVLLSNPNISMDIYYNSSDDIHINYLSQGTFIIQLFNSIIIATMTISLIINAITFDSLFISYTSRNKIAISKVIVVLVIMLLLTLFETLILHFIPVLVYSKYQIDIKDILGFLYLYSYTIIEAFFSILVTMILPSVITPMISIFMFIVVRLLSNNITDVKNITKQILPIIEVNSSKLVCETIYLAPIWCILIVLLYISIYNIKDLKQN
ncbi:MAG: hypothetical protein IJA65_03145 [Acholeplasmatales bacterium]|nr:hypothetical protein [Acholeplasmatales bacterium]